MISIGSNGEKISYGVKHFNLDTEEELERFNGKKIVMGSTCFVIGSSKYYMRNGEQKWIEITPFGKTMYDDQNGNGVPDELEDVVYEGGLV